MAIAKYEKQELTEGALRGFLRLKPTQRDCAAFFQVSEDTIDRRCKEWGRCTFAEFREQNMVHTRNALVQKAISKALDGDNCMLIFCLKNICGWKDKHEFSGDDVSPINIVFTKEDGIVPKEEG